MQVDKWNHSLQLYTVFVLIKAPQKNNSTRGGNVQNENEFICVHMARGPEWRLN